MPLVASRSNASAKAFGWSSAPSAEVLGGMVLMTPTSIASTGTGNSSSIGANGSVTFSSCETLSLNGVFTSDYDNYMIVMRTDPSGARLLEARLRASGTDASGSNYTYQMLAAGSTTVSAGRTASQSVTRFGYFDGATMNGISIYCFGPYLSQPTALRSVTVSDNASAYIEDYASTHSLSSAYDGVSFLSNNTQTFTGLVSVYGLGG